MDKVALLARGFRDRNPDALKILRAFHSQYDDIVVVPFERDKQQGRGRGGLRKTFRPEAGEIYFNTKNLHYVLKKFGPKPTSTARKIKSKTIFNISLGDSAAISLDDVISALRVCEYNGWAVPFQSEVLVNALSAFESLDKVSIYEQSNEVAKQLRLYELAIEADVENNIVENDNDLEPTESLKAKEAISAFNPDSREACVVIAMIDNGVVDEVNRKSQQSILDIALGTAFSANDHRRVFQKLRKLELVEKGNNGKGFFLSSIGKQVATQLKRASEATEKPPTN